MVRLLLIPFLRNMVSFELGGGVNHPSKDAFMRQIRQAYAGHSALWTGTFPMAGFQGNTTFNSVYESYIVTGPFHMVHGAAKCVCGTMHR